MGSQLSRLGRYARRSGLFTPPVLYAWPMASASWLTYALAPDLRTTIDVAAWGFTGVLVFVLVVNVVIALIHTVKEGGTHWMDEAVSRVPIGQMIPMRVKLASAAVRAGSSAVVLGVAGLFLPQYRYPLLAASAMFLLTSAMLAARLLVRVRSGKP